jgi:hypothetical protein
MIAQILVAVLTAGPNFSTTAQLAALRAVGYPATHPVVVRTNVAGRLATVLTRGGILEGTPQAVPILVERFPDGWQAIESLNFLCRLESHAISSRDEAALLKGMPHPQNDRPCGQGEYSDSGAPAAVEAVRGLMRGPLLPWVAVSGDYAMGEWYGGGGGETFYRRSNGTWHRILGGGGAQGVDEMKSHGVPASVWCPLHVYDAKCPGDSASGSRS